jgi:hypothetical protein
MIDFPEPNFSDWYWMVQDHSTFGVFSSARGVYVPQNDPAFIAWAELNGSAFSIDTEANLIAMLSVRAPGVVVQTVQGLTGYANAKQWSLATAGFTVPIGGKNITFTTDEISMALITGKAVRFMQPGAPASTQWQTGPTTFITIAAADFLTAATAIADFMQSTFDKLAVVLSGIAAGTITTKAGVDAGFS